MRVLAGDVGGTKTRLAVARVEGSGASTRVELAAERRYASEEHDGLEAVVERFLDEVEEGEVEAACFGVAGPVRGGEVETTNLPWDRIEARGLQQSTGIRRVGLINDFSAIGYGIEVLGEEEQAVLQEGEPCDGGCRALVGAGTGLGQGYLVPGEGGWRAFPSEGGHADFAPASAVEWRLREYLARRVGPHVSWERVVSGPGLEAIYEFFVEEEGRAPCAEVEEAEESGEDAAPLISRGAREDEEGACRAALDLFVRAYGAEAGNLALKVLATGGVWVAGGIAPAILEWIERGAFLEAFRAKGRFRDLMERMPLRVILETRVGLRGAAVRAASLANEGGEEDPEKNDRSEGSRR